MISRFKKAIIENKIAILIGVILFFLPFFWRKVGEVDYGGDSTRLYLYDPISWLKNIALYFVSSLMSLGEAMPNFSLIPLLLLLALLKSILFNSAFLLNNFFNGVLLSGGFFLVYLIVKELLTAKENTKKIKYLFPSIISGLFFILSPLLIFQWERALYGFNQVLVYPLVFFLFLKFINNGKFKLVVCMSIVCFLFSLNFSYPTVPWLFAFFPFAFIFLFFYSHFNFQKTRFLKGIAVFVFLSLFLNSFDILPQIYSLVNPSQEMAMDRKAMGSSGLNYFLSVQPHVRLAYNLTGQDQYVITQGYNHPLKKLINDYGVKYLPIFFVYPLLIILGLVLNKHHFSDVQIKIARLLLLLFLILLFFMTSGVTNFGLNIYKMFFRLPWFSMFRSFYSKFAMVYIFFYSLLLSFSLTTVLESISSLWEKKILGIVLVFLILFNGWPLISGKIANTTLWRSENVAISSQINPNYETFLGKLREEKESFKVLSLPLTSENYQLLQGKDGGVYFGPSTISILGGKNSFNGITGFSIFWPSIQKMIAEGRYAALDNLLGFLNIGYVFHDTDDYIYNNFPDYPYSGWLKSVFPDQKMIEKFVDNLRTEKLFSIATYNLYKRTNLLPLFYIPRKIVSTNSGVSILPEIFSDSQFEERSAIFFLNDNIRFYQAEQERALNNSEVFVKAVPLGLDFFEIAVKDDIKEASYPFVHDRARNIWKWALLSEKYKEWKIRKDPSGLIRQKIFFANKRIIEVVSFNKYVDERFKIYSEKLSQIPKLLEKIEDDNERAELAYEFINNIESNSSRLKLTKIVNYSNWEQIINEAIKDTQKLLPDLKINERQYSLSVLKNGSYQIYIRNEGSRLADFNYLIKVDGQDIPKQNNPELNQNKLIFWGKVDLKKGISNLTISTKNNLNLFEENEWGESSSPTQEKYILKELPDFKPDYWYQISGKLADSNQNLKIILAEKQGNIADGQRRLSDLPEYRILREAVLNQDKREFDWFLGSSSVFGTVKMFAYDEETKDLEKKKVDKTLESFKVFNVLAPEIILKQLNGQSKQENSIPKISFQKINPTKYRLKIKGAKEPFSFVMNVSFSDGWKLYKSDRLKEEHSDEIADYFDGEIIEEKPLKVSFAKNIFETWGKKPIAENNHFLTNGYANSWLISPEDVNEDETYELIVEYVPQRLFYLGSAVSLIFLAISLIFILKRRL